MKRRHQSAPAAAAPREAPIKETKRDIELDPDIGPDIILSNADKRRLVDSTGLHQTATPIETDDIHYVLREYESDHYFGSFFDAMRAFPSHGSSEFAVGPALFAFVVGINAKTVIEVGRFTGFSTLALAGALRFLDSVTWSIPEVQKQRPDVDYGKFLDKTDRIVISVDPDNSYDVAGKMETAGLSDYVKYVYSDSHVQNITPNLLAGELADFVFLDGDHSYSGLMQDISIYVDQYLKPGGYFALHDYFGWYRQTENGLENGSEIKAVTDAIKDRYQHILIDTGFMSLMMFRKPV